MRKKAYGLLIVILSTVLLIGCRVYEGKDHDLYQQVKSSVLCTNTVRPGQSISLETIDEDQYGRRLFRYFMYVTAVSEYKQVSVIAVSQKTVLDWVYYYEDVNFVMAETFEEIDKQAIEALKIQNDWGQPLDERKMTRRKIYGERDHVKQAYANFVETMPIASGGDVTPRLSDFDGKGKVLYYYFIYDADWKDDISVDTHSYIAVLNEDGTYDANTWIVELEDIYAYQEQLHALKLANGWTFGTN